MEKKLNREMSDIFSSLRTRIHNKSHDYFAFSHGRWDDEKRHLFYGATDALLDASLAARGYQRTVSADVSGNLLACYGFLQALYIEQDAIITLSEAVGLPWDSSSDPRLKEIREARNRLSGHPARAGKKDKKNKKGTRLSSAIIPYQSISKSGFRGHIYYEDGVGNIAIDVAAFQRDNEEHLAVQMEAIETEMDKQERQFRAQQSENPFSQHFGGNFEYLLQRLRCELDDTDRRFQALAHVEMIRERIERLAKQLLDTNFKAEAKATRIIFCGLDLLKEILDNGTSGEAQDHFDLVYGGLRQEIVGLKATIESIDIKMRTPI